MKRVESPHHRPAQAGRTASGARVALCALLFGTVAWLFVERALHGGAGSPTVPIAGDLLTQYHVIMAHGFAWLRAGTLPLWNPHLSCGTPFAGASHQGFVYPLYLPYLFFDGATAMDIHIALHLLVACLGVALLGRRLGFGWAACVVAGLIYGYQGSMAIKVLFPDFVASAAWIPWTFLTVDLVLAHPSPRHCAALAAVIGLSLLGGHGPQFLYFTAWSLLPFVAVRTWQIGRRAGAAAVGRAHAVLAAGAALGILVALIRLLPFGEHIGESWRPPGNFHMDVLSIVSVVPRAFVESVFSPVPPPNPRWSFSSVDGWRQAYAGIAPLILAGLGLLTWRQRGVALAFAAAAAGAVLYSFGIRTWVFPIFFHLPGGSWFRGLDRVLIIFGLAVAVLSGAGLDRIIAPEAGTASGRSSRGAAIAWAVGVSALVLGLGLIYGLPLGHADLARYCLTTAALLSTAVLVRTRPVLRWLVVTGIAALVTVDLVHAERFAGALPSTLGTYYQRYDDFFAAIRQRQGFDRTYIWSNFGWGQPLYFYSDIGKAGLLHDVYLPTDYDTTGSQRSADFLGALGQQLPLPIGPIGYVAFTPSDDNIGLLQLLGVRFFLMDDAQEARLQRDYPPLLAHAERILHRGGVSLYEYRDAMPRAFIASQAAVVPADQTLDRMRGADLRTQAFVEDPAFRGLPADSARAPAGRAEITQYEPNRVVVQTNAAATGLLVLTDQYYPGWRVTVDGAPATLYRTDYLFRGVVVPAGQHRVEFTYRPLSWILGAAGSVLGLVILVLLLRVGR